MSHRSRVTAAALAALVLTCTSCSDDEPQTDDPAAASSTPSSDPAAQQQAVIRECTVTGFVPGHRVVATRQRTVLAYAESRTLSPGGIVRGTTVLPRWERVSVRVGSPDGPVPAALRTAVLGSTGVAWPTPAGPPDTSKVPFSLRNTSDVNRSYVVYRPARVVTGRWSAEQCGDPYNDGASVVRLGGRFTSLARVQPVRTLECGADPQDDAERAAAALCRL